MRLVGENLSTTESWTKMAMRTERESGNQFVLRALSFKVMQCVLKIKDMATVSSAICFDFEL